MAFIRSAFLSLLTLGTLVCGVIVSVPDFAHAETEFEVKDLQIVGDGDSGMHARDAAINAGIQQGLRTIIAHLSSEEKATAANIKPGDLTRLVEGYEVKNEHISPNHYEATIHITFNPLLTKQYLATNGFVSNQPAVTNAESSQLFVVQVNSPERLADVRKRLQDINVILRVEVKEITISQMVVNVVYKGGLEALNNGIIKAGFLVSPRRGIPLLQLIG